MVRLDRRTVIAVGLGVMLLSAGWLLRGQLTAQVDSYEQCLAQGYPVSESEPPTCHDGRHAFLGPRQSPLASPEPVAAQEFSILVDGDSGGDYPQRFRVITNQADWQRYWTKVHAALPALPPILPVDFATHDVITLSQGRQMTNGYSLKVTGVGTGRTGTSIQVTVSTPTVTCPVKQTPSNRYLILQTTKLTEPVSFRTTNENRRCDK